MELQVGVKICLINNNKRILMLKRSDKYSDKYGKFGGQWDIVGGRIEPGKTLSKNLKREIKEETGQNWNEVSHLIAAQDILSPDRHIVRLTFIGKVKNDFKVKIDEEHTDYKWFSLKQLKEIPKGKINDFVYELIKNKTLSNKSLERIY